MYLWQPVAGAFYPPCVDGDYDAGVIGHEYGHMIENRMIGKGGPALGFQAGAMGEAVGDLDRDRAAQRERLVPTGDENPFATGTYATGNKVRGIRNYAANWPSTGAFPTPGVEPQVDPLNFSDVGYDLTGPEVHADGEIWVAINFEVRKALVAKYNAQFPRERPGAAGAVRGRRAAGRPVPGQPALDPAAVRRVPARCRRTRRWWTRATRSSRPTRPGSAARTRTSCGRRSRAAASAGSPRRTTPRAACAASSPTRTRCRTSRPRARPTRR